MPEFDNQTLEQEQTQDVSTTESSTAVPSQDSPVQETAPATDANQQPADKQLPFHEHPRFRELVEQKNQFAERTRQYESQLAQVQRQLAEMQKSSQSKQAQEDALLARLKQIDPEFGERFAKVDSSIRELEELKAWKANYEIEQVRQRGVQMVNDLHSKHSVPAEMQNLYNAQIEAAIRANPNAQLSDLPGIYQSVHDTLSKIFEARDRTNREKYVADKKTVAAQPSTPKGKAPTQSTKMEWSKDPEERRQQLVERVRKQMAAEKNL